MKKTMIAVTMMLSSGFAMANTMPNSQSIGGFEGPLKGVNDTVAKALSGRDGAPVQITGNLVNSLGDEMYTFTDGTETILIEIDDGDWAGLSVTPNDKVTIMGEIEKDWSEVHVEVDRIQKVG